MSAAWATAVSNNKSANEAREPNAKVEDSPPTPFVKVNGNLYLRGSEPAQAKKLVKPEPLADTTFTYKHVLRSIIGGDSGNPEIQGRLNGNFQKLLDVPLVWQRPDDRAVFDFVREYHRANAQVPGFEVVRDHFERKDDLLITERLKDFAETRAWFGDNFSYGVKQLLEEERRLSASALLKEAEHKIARGGSIGEALALVAERGAALTATAKTEPAKILHVGCDEILKPLGPIPWVCEGLRLAPGGGIYMIGGYGFSAKTMVLQHIELCIASGLPIFGIHAVKQGRVLHLDYEQGKRLTYERFQRLAHGMGLDFEKLVKEDRLRVAVFPDLKLDDDEAEGILKATLDEGFDFIGADPFRAACPGMDENSSTAREPLDMLNRVCGDARVGMMLHHSTKPPADGKGRAKRFSLRGSSAIFDALAGAFVLTKDNEDKDGPITATHEKEKWRGVVLQDFGVRVADVRGENAEGIEVADWGLRVEHLDEKGMASQAQEALAVAVRADADKIAAHLSNQPDGFVGTQQDLAAAVGMRKARVGAAMRLLKKAGSVTGDGKKDTPFRFVATAEIDSPKTMGIEDA